jgi:hypothetical protein
MNVSLASTLRAGAALARDAAPEAHLLETATPHVPLAGPRFDVDVLVGGAGPGGGTAAAIAAGRGAKVLVAEARPFPTQGLGDVLDATSGSWGQRWQHVIVRGESMADLRRAGVADELFSQPGTTFLEAGRTHGIAAIGPAEQLLYRSARSRGAAFAFGTAVEHAVPIPGGGTLVSLAGHVEPIRARTYIDATGGRAPFLGEYGIGLGEPRTGAGSYFLGHYPVQPLNQLTGNQVRTDAVRGAVSNNRTTWSSQFGQVRANVFNHPRFGAHVDIHVDKPLGTTDPAELAAIHHRLAHSLGVVGEPSSPPYLVSVVEREAPHVVGRGPDDELLDMMTIGDGIARKQPREAQGFNGAVQGGHDAAEVALLEGPQRATALREFEQAQLRLHHGAMRSHSYEARELQRRMEQQQRAQAEFLASMARRAKART